MELLCDSAGRKYPFVLGMSLRLQPGGGLVRVGPSPVHGLGVFAARAIPKNTIFTSYPIDLLVLRVTGRGERQPSDPCVVLSRKHANCEVDAHKRLREQYSDYALEAAEDVTVYADSATHTPGACGHLINDPGAPLGANCVECPVGGGVMIGMLTLREVTEGEELLMHYGEAYWRTRAGKTRLCPGTPEARGETHADVS